MKTKSGKLERTFADQNMFVYLAKANLLAFEPAFHSRFELLYILEGSCDAIIDEKKVPVKKDEIVIVNKYETHYYIQNSSTISAYVLVADDFYMSEFYSVMGYKKIDHICRNKKCTLAIRKIFEDWFEAGTDNKLTNCGFFNLIIGKLTEYSRVYVENENKLNGADILKYIRDNYKESLTMRSVAEKFGYSEVYFSRKFNRLVGMNFRTYLNMIRMEQAKILLKNGDRTVADVAESVGFPNLVAYYRAKKKTYSTPPPPRKIMKIRNSLLCTVSDLCFSVHNYF